MGKPTFWGVLDTPPPKDKPIYAKHEVGPEKKTVFVKLPNIDKMKKIILARKLIRMNYAYSGRKKKHLVKCTKFDSKGHFTLGPRTRRDSTKLKSRKDKKSDDDTPCEENSEIQDGDIDYDPNTETDVSDGNLVITQAGSEPNSHFETEDWQRRHFARRMKADLFSSEVGEIMTNARMTSLSRKDVSFPPTRSLIYMETLRDAINVHDWARVAKCVEGLSLESHADERNWLIWSGGFLALMQLSRAELLPLVEFTQAARVLLKGYPRRFGIELATWFTQKGHFIHGLCILQEWHEMSRQQNYSWLKPSFSNNPKRNVIDLIALLYEAVFHYMLFKRDAQFIEEGKYDGDEDSLTRCGEKALAMFEGVMELSEKTETDVTIFIEPFIELVWRFRGDARAKEIFENVCGKHYRNSILDKMYIVFLKEHFPHLKEVIQEKEAKLARFDFEHNRGERKADENRVRNYLQRANPAGSGVPFKKIENPGFSW